MDRKLVVTVSRLTDPQRLKIAADAEAHGFKAVFFKDAASAMEEAREAEIIFGSQAELMKNAPLLRWFASSTAGVNQFTESGMLQSEKVMLTSSSGAYGVTISEHVIMLLLEVLRRQTEHSEMIRNRKWDRSLTVRSVFGSRITLLGTGDIGQETAWRLRAFRPASMIGINTSGVNPEGLFDEVYSSDDLPKVLPLTEILIASLPSTSETHHMLNRDTLSLLPDGAVIVNVGRGSLLDETALEKELRSGRLFAALDVFEQEPLPASSSLWDCPNLLITPHVAGNMTLAYTADRIVAQFLENLDRYCRGTTLLHLVDLKKGY